MMKRTGIQCGALVLAAVLGAGCAPRIYVSSSETVNPRLQRLSAHDLATIFNRQARAGEHMTISATLWDLSWIVAFQEGRATRKALSVAEAKQNIAAWRVRFLQGQTAFRVRVEILHVPAVTEGSDPVTRLRAWSWKLRFSDGKTLAYRKVHVEVSRRWADGKGAYSFRLDGTVHFGRRLDPRRDRWVELVAYPPGDRPAVALRWYLRR